MYYYYCNILLFISCIITPNIHAGIPKVLEKAGEPNNPGLLTRMTQKAFDHLNDVATAVMIDQISHLNLNISRHDPPNGYFEVVNLHTVNFKAPTSTKMDLLPPDSFVWQIKGLEVTLQSNSVDVNYKPRALNISLQGKGQIMVVLQQIDFEIKAIFWKSSDNKLRVKRSDCELEVGVLEPSANGTGNVFAIFGSIKSIIANAARPIIQKKFCEQIGTMIDNNLSNRFQSLTFKESLRDNQSTTDVGEKKKLDRSSEQFQFEKFYVDYTLIAPPKVTEEALELLQKGEITYPGQYSIPFYPEKMETHARNDKMIQIFFSDYVLNSLYYHIQQQQNGLIDVTGENFPDTAKLLQVSCSNNEECLGNVIPELKTKFQNQIGEIRLQGIEMTYCLFKEQLANVITKSFTALYLHESGVKDKTFALSAAADGTTQIDNLSIDQNVWLLQGKPQLKDFDFNVKNSRIGTIENAKAKQKAIGQLIAKGAVTSIWQDGIRLPRIKQFDLINAEEIIRSRTIEIDADLKGDIEKLKEEANQAIRKSFKDV